MAAFQLILLDEAKKFLDNIPQNAHKKVLYNMWRVSGGEKNIELFKKLEKSENLGISHIIQRNSISTFRFLGYRRKDIGGCHSRNH